MLEDDQVLTDRGGCSTSQSGCEEEHSNCIGLHDDKCKREKSIDKCHISSEGRIVRYNARLYEDNEQSVGGKVKKEGSVLRTLAEKHPRLPNLTCRVETFGQMCDTFDCTRKKWVKEMGFGGLLYLTNKSLPRNLCYWLLTRVDPINAFFHTTDRQRLKLSSNQVGWVLGIPKGSKPVPTEGSDSEMKERIQQLYRKYGKFEDSNKRDADGAIKGKGIHITCNMLSLAERHRVDHEEFEFKTLFLLLSLHMVLCPTQGSRMANDLVAAVCCADDSKKYDWCGLVFNKLMDNIKHFGRRFYVDGYVVGCGGYTIYLAIYYLDRLNRIPHSWCISPRLKAWSMEEIRAACNEDRHDGRGDYGYLGNVDVAYGEPHPCDIKARDPEPPCSSDVEDEGKFFASKGQTKRKLRRGIMMRFNSQMRLGASLEKYTNGASSSGT